MKTIIETATKDSLYLVDDSETISLTDDGLFIGDPVTVNDLFCNSSTVSIVSSVSDPGDWWGRKYKYDDGWTNNHPTGDGKTWTWNNTNGKWEDG